MSNNTYLYVTLAWIGQAILREPLDSPIALFDHAFDLAYGGSLEGCIGLAQSVLNSHLCSSSYQSNDSNIINVAVFAMEKYIEQCDSDPYAYHLMGLLRECCGQYAEACDCFTISLKLLEFKQQSEFKQRSQQLEQLELANKRNLARCLCSAKRFKESIECYEQLLQSSSSSPDDPILLLGYSAALFFDNQDGYLQTIQQLNSTLDNSVSQLKRIIVMFSARCLLLNSNHRQLAVDYLLQRYACIIPCITYYKQHFSFEKDKQYICLLFASSLLNTSGNVDWIMAEAAMKEARQLPVDIVSQLDADDWIDQLCCLYYTLQVIHIDYIYNLHLLT